MVKISFLNTFKNKNMKPLALRILLLLLLATLPCSLHAQSTYLIFKLTNAAPGSTQKLREFPFERNGETITIGTYGSYGSGINFQAGIGKMLNPTFGFEITGEFAYGRWHKTDIEEYTNEYEFKGYLREKVNTVLIKPVVVIRNSGDLLSFYTKLGIIIAPFIRKYEQVEVSDREYATNTSTLSQFNSIEKARLKVGFTASFGVSFRVSERVSLLGEVSGQIMSLPIHKGHYTKAVQNGLDVLPYLNKADKEWEYKESGYLDKDQPADQPGIRLYNPANYTAIGLSAGLVYHL
jgi:opacity protein-like surface antigen